MARILLLGTWLTDLAGAREGISARGENLSFGGMSSQLEVTGPRIEVERRWVVNDRTWKHGMPRSIVEGQIEQMTDDVFVVVDEPRESDGRRGPRRS
jgi:hypothetical protein